MVFTFSYPKYLAILEPKLHINTFIDEWILATALADGSEARGSVPAPIRVLH